MVHRTMLMKYRLTTDQMTIEINRHNQGSVKSRNYTICEQNTPTTELYFHIVPSKSSLTQELLNLKRRTRLGGSNGGIFVDTIEFYLFLSTSSLFFCFIFILLNYMVFFLALFIFLFIFILYIHTHCNTKYLNQC